MDETGTPSSVSGMESSPSAPGADSLARFYPHVYLYGFFVACGFGLFAGAGLKFRDAMPALAFGSYILICLGLELPLQIQLFRRNRHLESLGFIAYMRKNAASAMKRAIGIPTGIVIGVAVCMIVWSQSRVFYEENLEGFGYHCREYHSVVSIGGCDAFGNCGVVLDDGSRTQVSKPTSNQLVCTSKRWGRQSSTVLGH